MFSFLKKSNTIDSPNLNTQSDDLKTLAESVYKKNIELGVTNKTLSLLSKLYEISILSLEPQDMAQRVSEEIQVDLVFEIVGILLYNNESEVLNPLAFANSERLHKIESTYNTFFDKTEIPLSHSQFLKKIISSNKSASTEQLTEVWDSLVSKEMLERIVSEGHVKSSIVYPLVSGGTVIGAMLFGLNRSYEQLIDHEKTSIESFVNVVAVALDKALLDEQLKELNLRLKSVNTILSHDVKGVLGKNKDMFRALLDDDFGTIPDAIKPFVQQSYADTEKLIHSVVDILASGSNLTLQLSPFDLKAATLEVLEDVKKDAQIKNLSVECVVNDADYTIVADKTQLVTHVLRNLMENAVNYNIQNGSLKISLSRKDSDTFVFVVSDTGIGINEEDKKNIFKEGGHGKDSIKTNVHSSGYGLSTAKKTVLAHGGKISFTSEGVRCKGSTFTVELPVITKVQTNSISKI